VGVLGQECGMTSLGNKVYGCSLNENNITQTNKPSTFNLYDAFAHSNSLFLEKFAIAFNKMASVGYGVPENIDGSTAKGKLGTLTAFEFDKCSLSSTVSFPSLSHSSSPTVIPSLHPSIV
jgi:hypothetical protein